MMIRPIHAILLAGLLATGTSVAAPGNSIVLPPDTPGVDDPPVAYSQRLIGTEDEEQAVDLRGIDPEHEPLTYEIVEPPKFGRLTGTPPKLVYVPDRNAFGIDRFRFIVGDGALFSAPAAVDIEVSAVNDPPVARNIRTEVFGRRKTFRLKGSDVEAPPYKLFYRMVGKPPSKAGKLSVSRNGRVRFVAKKGFKGKVRFHYQSGDGELYSKRASVVLAVMPNQWSWTPRNLFALEAKTKTTQSDDPGDLGRDEIQFTRAQFESGEVVYDRLSKTKCRITFQTADGGSAAYILRFESRKKGRFEFLRFDSTGTARGTFRIVSMETEK